jgi:hypothetical protein
MIWERRRRKRRTPKKKTSLFSHSKGKAYLLHDEVEEIPKDCAPSECGLH